MEYLSNVGRTFRFYLDKYSNIMTSEVFDFSIPLKEQAYVSLRKLFFIPSSRAACLELPHWISISAMIS